MKNLTILLITFYVIISCTENDRHVYCDKSNFFCIHTDISTKKDVNFEKIKSIFLNNKFNFLKENKEFICFEYYNNHVEIYNYNNKTKYCVVSKYAFTNADTSKKVIKEYLTKLSYDFTINNLLKKDDTLVLRNFRLPRSFLKSSAPPPLPPEMMFPVIDKDSLYHLQHNFDM